MGNLGRAQAMQANRTAAANLSRAQSRQQATTQKTTSPQGDSVEISREAKQAQALSAASRMRNAGKAMQTASRDSGQMQQTGLRNMQFSRMSVRSQTSQTQQPAVGQSVFRPRTGMFANPTMSPQGQNIDTGATIQFSERTSVSFSTKG